MSANHSMQLSIPIHILAALAVGSAAMSGSGAALASMMVSREMGLSAAAPLATAAACAGSLVGGWLLAALRKSRGLLWGILIGAVYALALLGLQLSNENVPDLMQGIRLGLMVLAGATGGYLGTLRSEKKRRR